MFELHITTGAGTVALRFSDERTAKVAYRAAETASNKGLALVLYGKDGEVLLDLHR